MKNIKSSLIVLMACCTFSCNDTDQLPVGAEIKAFPEEVSWIVGPAETCVFSPDYYNDTIVSLSLVDENNSGIVDAAIDVSLDLSEATFTGTETLRLYYDKNADGIYSEDEKVSVADGPLFSARTDSLNGVLRVMVRVNLSCPYKGTLYAYAGNTAAAVGFDIKENDTNDDGDETDEEE